MRRNRGFLLLAVLFGGIVSTLHAAEPIKAPVAATQKDDAKAFELPGSFRPDDNLATLRKRFGADQVKAVQLDGAEGETFPGLVVFGDDPQRRLEVILRDADKQTGIESLRAGGAASRWHLDNGVKVGMTLAALAALNGKVVEFSGLDWDYGGSVLDWHGGKLAQSDKATVFRSVSLSASATASTDGAAYPSGDAPFLSNDPKYPRVGTALVVAQIMVSFVQP